MKTSILDNPIWHALSTHQSKFSLGSELAKRYQPDVAPFVAMQNHQPECLSALASLIADDDVVYLLGDEPRLPQNFNVKYSGIIAQMVCENSEIVDVSEQDIFQLSSADVPDMLALTALTFPGYFRPRTYEMGDYFGVRHNGLLIAMAGERMSMPGYQEISAVCTHPDFRGQGHAERLIRKLISNMWKRGTTPFLHVGDENEKAKRLYEKLGFVERSKLPIWSMTREKATWTGLTGWTR